VFCHLAKGEMYPHQKLKQLGMSFFALKTLFGFSILIATMLGFSDSAYAESKASSLFLTVTPEAPLSLEMLPAPSGAFDETNSKTINVRTDNFSGYTLKISSQTSPTLVGIDEENNDTIDSIDAIISESVFRTNAGHNNKFGYKPSQYIDGGSAVTNNTNFLPIPSLTGDTIDVTSTSNTTDNSYTISFGVKIDYALTPGDYRYVYLITVTGNDNIFNITYDSNTDDTVTNMPSPNPQPISIGAGTAVEDSHGTLSDSIPTRAGHTFMGWCDVATTLNSTTGYQECSGTVYQPESEYEIDQTEDENITLYAIWANTLFPIVWNQQGACEFHGATNGNITGLECSRYWNDRYIDTEIPLYSTANIQKDYEIHMKIDHYVPGEQVNYYGTEDNSQQTFFSDRLSSTGGDGSGSGVIMRRNKNDISILSKTALDHGDVNIPYTQMTEISVYRIDSVIYYSLNGGPLVRLHWNGVPANTFDLPVWFGAYPENACTGDGTIECTEKRIPEATFSNMYVRLGDAGDELHRVTFNGNGGTASSSSMLIFDGNQILSTNLPTATRDDYVFMGWFDDPTDGSRIQTPFTPSSDITFYAHWKKSVAEANITNQTITIAQNTTETVNVTNASELEPYTFSSDDDSIATVDSATGEITGIAPGVATITMTGANSGATKTITVTVSAQTYIVSFDSQGGSSVADIQVSNGSTIDSLPTSLKTNYVLEGWYTGTEGTGTKLTTSTVFDSNTPIQYYANWEESEFVCKIATELHIETCGQANGKGCRFKDSNNNYLYAQNEEITYGTIPNSTTKSPGFAYTCDVNSNNIFDEDDERFYYIGTNNGNAVLIYYRDVDSVGRNYTPAFNEMPDSSTWANTNLVTQDGGKVARFLTKEEATAVCGAGNTGLQDRTCEYLLEKSNYANTDRQNGIWLEKVNDTSNGGRRYLTDNLVFGTRDPNNSVNATRPVIEVPFNLIEEYVPEAVTMHSVTFNSNGGSTGITSDQIAEGTAIGALLPTPTKENYKFFGWYADDGTFYNEVTPATVVDSDATYYAKWVEDTADFPVVWSEVNACTFSSGNVSGNYCAAENKSKSYIDTNIQLFIEANYDKDFEVGFTIVDYKPSNNTNQATFVNSKQEISANDYPGFVVRRMDSTNNIQITQKWKNDTIGASYVFNYENAKTVKVMRRKVNENGTDKYKIYYSVNDGAEVEFQDITNTTRFYFDTEVWFGSSVMSDGTSSQRPFKGTLTDMYIKLSANEEYEITFDGNGGEPSETSREITQGNALGSLPTATHPVSNYSFAGWYNEQGLLVDDGTTYIPTKSETLTAHWDYNSSDEIVSFDTSNSAMKGYYNIIDGWVASANITTFNKDATTINNSTWGDTNTLSENSFWAGLENNFVTNQCDMNTSYNGNSESKKPWTSGNVDCSKPSVYNTGLDTALKVYLYDNSKTDNKGDEVFYTKSSNGTIANMVPGVTYRWEKDGDSSIYGYVRATADHGTRMIDAGSVYNVRDLGGLPVSYTNGTNTVTGTIKYETLFRGGKLGTDSSNVTEISNLAPQGNTMKEYDVAGDLGTQVSLASKATEPIKHYVFDADPESSNNRSVLTKMMTDIVSGNTSIYFHCRVGADRTGTAAYLLEGLLGVPDEVRYEEYELTHLGGLTDRTRYYKEKTGGNPNPTKKFVYMMGYMQTAQDIYNWYTNNGNDTTAVALVDSFRAAMVIPTNSQQNSTNNTQSLNSPRSLSAANNTVSVVETDNAELDKKSDTLSATSDDNNGKSENTYSDPLGVSQASDSSSAANTASELSVLAGAVIAVASAAAVGGTAYSIAKRASGD